MMIWVLSIEIYVLFVLIVLRRLINWSFFLYEIYSKYFVLKIHRDHLVQLLCRHQYSSYFLLSSTPSNLTAVVVIRKREREKLCVHLFIFSAISNSILKRKSKWKNVIFKDTMIDESSDETKLPHSFLLSLIGKIENLLWEWGKCISWWWKKIKRK